MARALLSVTDKTGVAELGRGLAELGYELISTGGTAAALRAAGLTVCDVAEITGFPEMMDGRLKTLHPMVHGGLLADRSLDSHRVAMQDAGIEAIDVLVVNLYRFEATVTAPHEPHEAIESIDIGGPAMIRAAAKNHAHVTVLVDPADYPAALEAMRVGRLSELRPRLAAKAFRHTAYYDSVIARYLTERCGEPFPTETWTLGLRWDGQALRYGENPHQVGARFLDPLSRRALQPMDGGGKEVSYNNWLDADAAWSLACDLPPGACVIVKHGNPCGAAVGPTLGESYRLAKASDPVSAFGGIVAFHGPLDEDAVAAMLEKGNFLEVVIAPGMRDSSLLAQLRAGGAWTANLRVLRGSLDREEGWTVRSVLGGALVQETDVPCAPAAWRTVTTREPTGTERDAMCFAWAIVPHVKSNAIVVAAHDRLLGVGAGQMNRVQSVRLALDQAGPAATSAALASDAFFPFPDSIETAAQAGIRAIIQPGGSKKDDAVIEAANHFGIAMVFTDRRHFRH